MRSDMPLSEWRGDVSGFDGQFYTTPAYQKQGVTCAELAELVCPKEPFVTSDKSRAPYALPCTLNEALLVGKTLERAKARGLSLIGFMRSANHVTEGRWIKLDLDGAGKDDVRGLLEKLDALGIGYLLYSTHSHGLKARNRLRLVLFLDRALPSAEYRRASQGAAQWLLGGSLDDSEAGLHQLAGVYMCHPDRRAKSFRLVDIGTGRYCVSADALLALVPKVVRPAYRSTPASVIAKGKVGDELRWVDANDTRTWVQVGMALKALEGALGADALGHWLAFSDSADESAKGQNNDPRYDPETMFEGFSPVMSAEAAMGQVLALGRDGAGTAVKEALSRGDLGKLGREAVVYLERRHPRFINSLLAKAGFGGDV